MVEAVFRGEGFSSWSWWRHAKLRKLMEEENCRNLTISRLNKSFARRMSQDDHVEDIVRMAL